MLGWGRERPIFFAPRTVGGACTPLRRFTRLTNAFSKKVANHYYALAIYFMHYNFVRIHQSLRVTPAMAAGVSRTLWSMNDILGIVESLEKG
jgi:hypothetical protein